MPSGSVVSSKKPGSDLPEQMYVTSEDPIYWSSLGWKLIRHTWACIGWGGDIHVQSCRPQQAEKWGAQLGTIPTEGVWGSLRLSLSHR